MDFIKGLSVPSSEDDAQAAVLVEKSTEASSVLDHHPIHWGLDYNRRLSKKVFSPVFLPI